MSEQIPIKRITSRDFVAHALLHMIAKAGTNKFQIVPGAESVTAEVKINGIDVSLIELLESFGSQWDSIMNKEINQRMNELFSGKECQIQEIMSEAREKFNQILSELPYLPDEPRRG